MADHQLPEDDEVFLDHVGWFVKDLDQAAAQLARLGFQVSAENVHMNMGEDGKLHPSGTINRLAILGLGYLEFLSTRGESVLTRQLNSQMARYQGLHLMAFNSADVPAEAPRLAREGFAPQDVLSMRRAVHTPDGAQEGRFSVLRVQPGVMPEGRIQWCGHHTPEHVWHPSLTVHPNGAQALAGALWIVEDVEEALDRYSRFVRKPTRKLGPGAGEVLIERGPLILATHEAARRFIPALEASAIPFGAAVFIQTESMAATEVALSSNDIPTTRHGESLLVAPADALGTWLCFSENARPTNI